jgi:hypothetical protein
MVCHPATWPRADAGESGRAQWMARRPSSMAVSDGTRLGYWVGLDGERPVGVCMVEGSEVSLGLSTVWEGRSLSAMKPVRCGQESNDGHDVDRIAECARDRLFGQPGQRLFRLGTVKETGLLRPTKSSYFKPTTARGRRGLLVGSTCRSIVTSSEKDSDSSASCAPSVSPTALRKSSEACLLASRCTSSLRRTSNGGASSPVTR